MRCAERVQPRAPQKERTRRLPEQDTGGAHPSLPSPAAMKLIFWRYAHFEGRHEPTKIATDGGNEVWLGPVDAALSPFWLRARNVRALVMLHDRTQVAMCNARQTIC